MITFDDFKARVGREFQAATESGPVTLQLTTCQTLTPNGDTHSFSLTFTSGTDTPIGQGSYHLSAAGFGPELIFLVPTGIDAGAMQYQALFHRLPN